jgi:serine/threonine protein kinase
VAIMSATSSSACETRADETSAESARYRLVSRIATGGMAEIFLALMPGVCGSVKPVVIKRLWPELARHAEFVEMFLDEVRLSLNLHHPNVIHAYEFGRDRQQHYLAMEYLDGQSLKHIVDRMTPEGGLILPLSLKIISDVLAGLEYIHALTDLGGTPMGIVHRDVSPQNVFVTCDGAVKLIDFGIAQTAATKNRPHARDPRGRVAYMAPEQVAGGVVDHRADLFSVGVMLWEMTVGQRLWQGMTDMQIANRLCTNEPLSYLPKGRGFPPGLAAICARALALDPRDRYSNASEFQSDLATVLTGSMPVQARLLGKLVSRVFANTRALARSMIQQSLPSGQPSGSLATIGLVRGLPETHSLTSNSALPVLDQNWQAIRTDQESGNALAAFHDDITQVAPIPELRPQRKPRVPSWFLTGTGILILLFGLAMLVPHRAQSSRQPQVDRSIQPPAVFAQPAHTPEVDNTSEEGKAADGEPVLVLSHDALPEIARRAGARPIVHIPRPRKQVFVQTVTTRSTTERDAVAVRDFFDVQVTAKKPPLPSRSIDREDPYRP